MKLYRLLFREGVAQEGVCARRALHSELAAYCAQDVVIMSQYFRTVSQWLCDWYERCYGGIKPGDW